MAFKRPENSPDFKMGPAHSVRFSSLGLWVILSVGVALGWMGSADCAGMELCVMLLPTLFSLTLGN